MTYSLREDPDRFVATADTGDVLAGAFLPTGQPEQVGHNDWVVYAGDFAGKKRYHAHCASRAAAKWWVNLAASAAESWEVA